MDMKFVNGQDLKITLVRERIVRIQIAPEGKTSGDSALNRYGFIVEPDTNNIPVNIKESPDAFIFESPEISIEGNLKTGELKVMDHNGKILLEQERVVFKDDYAQAFFMAKDDDDWIGFGDSTRERLYHRDHVIDCHVRNVASYIPVPFFMSARGGGILVNTTHRIVFDMGKSKADEYSWKDERGLIDYYVIAGENFRETLHLYTDLTGKPKLPPEWAFGLWYICRMQANDYEVVNDALNFRREEIPCDVIGLEPGWMDVDYDLSVEKKWSKERFPIPDYCPNGPHNFLNAIKRMGFKLELWLCNEYDLSFEEERRINVKKNETSGSGPVFHENAEVDTHFSWPRYADKISRRGEAWFEHLKKFVDQGADFFKQDGAFQVCEHPDRVWGNRMLDNEMHNLYPLLYSRQMYEGFAKHTGRRPLVFTPAGWSGFQAWCGTWTGDTGGRLDTLGAMLNTAIVGHSWTTNDMEVTQKEGIHFGYLLPWCQINSWNYFRMPWLQGSELGNMHKYYSRLRARMIPYLYSWAYYAAQTGYPLMAPLTLEFPNDKVCRNNLHQYLLGRDLMVVIYKNNAYFPEGRWKDFWTGEVIDGKKEMEISWPDNRGGGLYVRSGGIIPFGPLMQYRGEKPLDEIDLYIFPDEKESVFKLYEDDGVTLKHLGNEFAITEIRTIKKEGSIKISIGEACGKYEGKVFDRKWSLAVAADAKPSEIFVNDERLTGEQFAWDDKMKLLKVQIGKGSASVLIKGL